MRKIKILMVAGDMHVGGIENQLMHFLRNVDRLKFQIDFTSTRPDAFYRHEIEQLGGNFILIPPFNWKRPQRHCEVLYNVMKQGHYDIVHSHELFHSGITLALAKRAGIPCRFVHAHNWSDGDGISKKVDYKRVAYNAVMRRLINRCSTVQVACSTWAGQFLYGSQQIKKPSYHVVYNSVDTTLFLDQYDQKEEGEFCDGWINILNVGRLTPIKNQLFLVEIANKLKQQGKKYRILCAGDGDEGYKKQVMAAIKDHQVESYIQLLGVRKDIDVLMRKSKAFILPSRYEGMPLVMIEAQASGLPCLSADTYSPEVDYEIGYLKWLSLENDSKDDWIKAIDEAVHKERAPKELVEGAIQRKGFDSQRFTEILCQLYEEDFLKRGL